MSNKKSTPQMNSSCSNGCCTLPISFLCIVGGIAMLLDTSTYPDITVSWLLLFSGIVCLIPAIFLLYKGIKEMYGT